MKRFIKNNQWGRRKTPLWKQFSVKTPGEPIVKTSLGVGVTRVRILKKSEIEELRQKGYTVEIIRKIQSRQPRSAADIIFKKETWQEHSSTFTVIAPITPPLHIEEGERLFYSRQLHNYECSRRIQKTQKEWGSFTYWAY